MLVITTGSNKSPSGFRQPSLLILTNSLHAKSRGFGFLRFLPKRGKVKAGVEVLCFHVWHASQIKSYQMYVLSAVAGGADPHPPQPQRATYRRFVPCRDVD